MLPVGGGAGAGPAGAARRRAQQSPQHQGHLVTGLGDSARGGKPAPISVAAPRDAPGWAGVTGGAAPRDAPGWGRCYRWCSPTGRARVGQVLPVVQPHLIAQQASPGTSIAGPLPMSGQAAPGEG